MNRESTEIGVKICSKKSSPGFVCDRGGKLSADGLHSHRRSDDMWRTSKTGSLLEVDRKLYMLEPKVFLEVSFTISYTPCGLFSTDRIDLYLEACIFGIF